MMYFSSNHANIGSSTECWFCLNCHQCKTCKDCKCKCKIKDCSCKTSKENTDETN